METTGILSRIVVMAILATALAFGLTARSASAANNCIQDIYQQHGNTQSLNCTANDVGIAGVNNICVGTCCTANGCQPSCNNNSQVTFTADFNVNLTSQARYDIGLYLAADGGNAVTGQCVDGIITSGEEVAPSVFDSLDGDACGDIDSSKNPQIVRLTVPNVLCKAAPGTNKLQLNNCTSWRQPGSNTTCSSPSDAFPGSPSKCNCQPMVINVNVETPTLAVKKTPDPVFRIHPGGDFTFTVDVANTSTFTSLALDKICDDKFGTIVNVSNPFVACPAGTLGSINSTTCQLIPSVTLSPGGGLTPPAAGSTYTCSFMATITASDEATIPDIVTVFAHDPNSVVSSSFSATAGAQVQITEEPPTVTVTKSFNSIPCAIIRYNVDVFNTGATDPDESVDLTALSDSNFGGITTVHDNIVATTCGAASPGPGALPANILPGAHYICTFDAKVCSSGTPGNTLLNVDTITATAKDHEENFTLNPSPLSNQLSVTVSGGPSP